MKMQRFWRALALTGLLAMGAAARAEDAPSTLPRVEPFAPAN
ncbi:periplasmic solute-binding protein [Burkholderia cenocepacia]|nr:periplasmic solute-binding protein [Burkholderia cenocepacia]